MNGAFSFGSYYPGSSLLHRADPRAKLLLGFALLGISLAAQDFAGLAVIAAFVSALYALSGIPPSKALRSLAPLMAIVVLASVLNLFFTQGGAVLFELGPIRISEEGVRSCLFIAARLLLMMMGMSLVTMTTTTLDLTEAFERLMAPFARIGLPAHELGMIMGIALRFMPQFATEFVTVYRAQISRGAGLSSSPVKGVRMLPSVVIPLFASVFRHAETLSAAMDARCYHGGAGRTRLHPLRFSKIDAGATVLFALMACGVVAANMLA